MSFHRKLPKCKLRGWDGLVGESTFFVGVIVLETAKRSMRLIVNGKAAGDPLLRPAIAQLREAGHRLDVRVTFEFGDAARYAREGAENGDDVIIAAGGDGTINEVAGGLLSLERELSCAMAVIPYGTANDFATGMGIAKGDPLMALKLAADGEVVAIDAARVNDRFFVNVASGGFGAEVTAATPPQLKKALGGVAYSLMGVVTAAKMQPHDCRFVGPAGAPREGKVLVMAVGNGRQCGGGYQVTQHAVLDDGLLDVMVVHDAEVPQLGSVLNELMDVRAKENRYVTYEQVPSLTIESARPMQLNLDGEPMRETTFEFRVLPQALPFVLGPNAPVQSGK